MVKNQSQTAFLLPDQLHHLVLIHYLTFLCFHFLILRMEIIIFVTSKACCENLNELSHVKHLEQCLTQTRLYISINYYYTPVPIISFSFIIK